MQGDDGDLTLAIHSPSTLSIISAQAVHAQGEEEVTMTSLGSWDVADWLNEQINSPSGELTTDDYWTAWLRFKVQSMDLGISIGNSTVDSARLGDKPQNGEGTSPKYTACVFKKGVVVHQATADKKKAATHLAAKWAWHTHWRDITRRVRATELSIA